MLVSFSFKQTGAAVAVVPLLALLLLRPKPLARHMALAMLPLAALAAVILAMKLFFPAVYYYVITVPTLFRIEFHELPTNVLQLVSLNILFVVLFMLWLAGQIKLPLCRAAMIWLLATIAVASSSSVLAVAKAGGGSNCYLPAFLAMTAFSIAAIVGLAADSGSLLRVRQTALVSSVIIGMLMLADTVSVPGQSAWYKPGPRLGDANYEAIIRRARTLPGIVLSPDDPTIALLAKGQLCRNYTIEFDATGHRYLPRALLGEWQNGNYIILARGTWTSRVSTSLLAKLGYHQIKDAVFDGTSYSLGKRVAPTRRKKTAPQQPDPLLKSGGLPGVHQGERPLEHTGGQPESVITQPEKERKY